MTTPPAHADRHQPARPGEAPDRRGGRLLRATFGRSADELLFWKPDETEPNIDFWAKSDESRAEIIDHYQRACAHADTTIDALPLDATGTVPYWPAEHAEVNLHQILVHVIAETNRHVGHADIVRELVDGVVGLGSPGNLMPEVDADWWVGYRERVENAARTVGEN